MSDLKAKTVNAGRQVWYKAKDIAGKAVDAGRNGVRWVIENPDKAGAERQETQGLRSLIGRVCVHEEATQ